MTGIGYSGTVISGIAISGKNKPRRVRGGHKRVSSRQVSCDEVLRVHTFARRRCRDFDVRDELRTEGTLSG